LAFISALSATAVVVVVVVVVKSVDFFARLEARPLGSGLFPSLADRFIAPSTFFFVASLFTAAAVGAVLLGATFLSGAAVVISFFVAPAFASFLGALAAAVDFLRGALRVGATSPVGAAGFLSASDVTASACVDDGAAWLLPLLVTAALSAIPDGFVLFDFGSCSSFPSRLEILPWECCVVVVVEL